MRLGLDLDDVVIDFTAGIFRVAGIDPSRYKEIVTYDYKPVLPDFKAVWNEVKDDNVFWLSLRAIETHIPDCCTHYVTARYCPNAITEEWLERNGLPLLPLVNVNHAVNGTPRDLSKTDKLAELGLDGLVDDKDKHFLDAWDEGFCHSFLVSRPWNRQVATPNRIYRLEELEWRQ